jgi:hypothetical protein
MCAHHSSPLVEAQSYRRGDWHIGRLEALPRVGVPTTFCQFPGAADSALIIDQFGELTCAAFRSEAEVGEPLRARRDDRFSYGAQGVAGDGRIECALLRR